MERKQKLKKKSKEQNEFLKSLLESFEDIKAGRFKEFDFSK